MNPSRKWWWRVGLAMVVIALFSQPGIARSKKETWLMKLATERHMVLTDAGCIDVKLTLVDDDVPSGRATLEPLLKADVERILRSASIESEGCSDSAPILSVVLAAFHKSTWGFVVEVSVLELVTIKRYKSRPPLEILSMAPVYRIFRLAAADDDEDPAGHVRRTLSAAVQEFADDYRLANPRHP